MLPTDKTKPCLVPPGAEKVVNVLGIETRIHLTGAQTGGRFAMFTIAVAPGEGPPPHYHVNEDEWFYVLEGGRAEFLKDGAWIEAAPGTAVYLPKGSTHTFRNGGEQPLRLLIHVAPAGLEKFFERLDDAFPNGTAVDMTRLVEISAEFGIYFVEP